jgi:hypothetical protein
MIRLGLAQVKTCFGTLESPFSSSSAGVSSGTQNFRKWPNPHVFIELRRIARLVSRFVPALSQLSAGTGKSLIIVELRPFCQRFPPNFKKCASIVPQRYPNDEGLALSVRSMRLTQVETQTNIKVRDVRDIRDILNFPVLAQLSRRADAIGCIKKAVIRSPVLDGQNRAVVDL